MAAGVGPTSAHEAEMLDTDLDTTGSVWAIALFTTMPTDDAGTGLVEVSGGNYSRITISSTSTDWQAAIPGDPTTKSGPKAGVTWAFNAPTANWGNIKGFGLYKSGVLKWVGPLPTPKDVLNGDPAPQFNVTHQIVAQLGDPTDTF